MNIKNLSIQGSISFAKQQRLKIGVILIRLILLSIIVWIKQYYHQTNNQIGFLLLDFFTASKQGAIIFMCFYAVRSLIFFPAGMMTIMGGILFGPVRGAIYTYIGENISATFSRWIGRYFRGKDSTTLPLPSGKIMHTIQHYLHGNDFLAVLTLRLIPINFDMINYVCGLLGVKRKPYASATALGIIPGMITYVLIGATFHDTLRRGHVDFDHIVINTNYLLLSGILYTISFTLAYLLKRKKSNKDKL